MPVGVTLARRGGLEPGPVVTSAVAYWRASQYSGSGDLLDESGNGLHAVLGAGAAAPKWLPYAGERYTYLSGVSANYISTPDSAALSITGDIDLRIRVAPDDWTAAGSQLLISKYGAAGFRSFIWYIRNTGTMDVQLSVDGTGATASIASTVALTTATGSGGAGAVDGVALWLRMTWRASDGRVQYFWHADQVSPPAAGAYTQLGTDRTAAIASIFDSTANVEIGSFVSGTSSLLTGKVHYADIRNGIDGTVAATFDASTLTSPFASVVGPQGNTWTLNRSASGRKLAVVDRHMFLLGTDDYFEVADNALLDFDATDSFTVVAALRYPNAPSGRDVVVAKKGDSGAGTAGYLLALNTNAMQVEVQIADGAAVVSSNGNADASLLGVVSLISLVRDVSADTVRKALNSAGVTVADTTTASLANALALRIGRFSTGTDFADMTFFGAAIFRRALTAAELVTVAQELNAV